MLDPPASNPGRDEDLLGGDLLGRLERWAADARVDEAVQRRARERWLRHQAEEAATFRGVLLDLAERGVVVTLQLRSGRRLHGMLHAIGADFCALRVARSTVFVRLDVIATLRPDPGAAPAVGDRQPDVALLLTEVVRELVAERERVQLVSIGGEPLAGELRALGTDVVTLRVDGAPPSTVYLRVDEVGEVVVPGGRRR